VARRVSDPNSIRLLIFGGASSLTTLGLFRKIICLPSPRWRNW